MVAQKDRRWLICSMGSRCYGRLRATATVRNGWIANCWRIKRLIRSASARRKALAAASSRSMVAARVAAICWVRHLCTRTESQI